jgi:hypothetical protein
LLRQGTAALAVDSCLIVTQPKQQNNQACPTSREGSLGRSTEHKSLLDGTRSQQRKRRHTADLVDLIFGRVEIGVDREHSCNVKPCWGGHCKCYSGPTDAYLCEERKGREQCAQLLWLPAPRQLQKVDLMQHLQVYEGTLAVAKSQLA